MPPADNQKHRDDGEHYQWKNPQAERHAEGRQERQPCERYDENEEIKHRHSCCAQNRAATLARSAPAREELKTQIVSSSYRLGGNLEHDRRKTAQHRWRSNVCAGFSYWTISVPFIVGCNVHT